MNRALKITVITVIAGAAIFFFYRSLIIRTVNYEIGGIKIPSKYNMLTGKVTPIKDYKGKEIERTVSDKKLAKIGLTPEEVFAAQVRWAVFEQWVKSRPQYKGWESDRKIFKKAQDDFLKEMNASGRKVLIVK